MTSTPWATRCVVLLYHRRGAGRARPPGPGSHVSISRTRQGAMSARRSGGPLAAGAPWSGMSPSWASGAGSQPTTSPASVRPRHCDPPVKSKEEAAACVFSCGRSPLTVRLPRRHTDTSRYARIQHRWEGRLCAQHSRMLPGAPPLPAAAQPASRLALALEKQQAWV